MGIRILTIYSVLQRCGQEFDPVKLEGWLCILLNFRLGVLLNACDSSCSGSNSLLIQADLGL